MKPGAGIGPATQPRAMDQSDYETIQAAPVEAPAKPVDIAALAAALREASSRPVPPERIADALGTALARWRDRRFTPRRRTVAAIAADRGWSEELLDDSIDALLTPFTLDSLRSLARHTTGSARLVGMIMPGNVPGAGLHELATALIAGCSLILKAASAEPIFFAEFARTLREADAEVARRLAVVGWGRERRDLTAVMRDNCGWIAAFGADETLADLERNAPAHPGKTEAGRLAAGFGQRFSGAVVAAESATATVADALARDASLFEQQGCLSPHHVFVETPEGGDAARDFARELAAAMERYAERCPPPCRYGLESAAAVRRVRESARWRALGGDSIELCEGERLSWTVVFDRAAAFVPSPGYRVVTVSPYRELDDLRRRLEPLAGRFEAFAMAASGGCRESLGEILKSLGVCYLSEPGAMQSPPLDWNHGGGAFARALVER